MHIWGAHLYRSDLGGMVNNSTTGDSYVTTTSSAVYLPRVGHHIYNGSTWVNEGVLHESKARTNLLLNSGTLATQSVTVTATSTTLSFTGTGTVTLTGVSTAGPLVGTGTGENNRVNLTFTPTAGTLTLTVSGTVTNAQLEAGETPSSYIPTAGATATRAAETLTVPTANLPYSSTNMSIQMDGSITYADTSNTNEVFFWNWTLNSSNNMKAHLDTNVSKVGKPTWVQKSGNVTDNITNASGSTYSPGINVPFNLASRHGSNFINGAADGTSFTVNATPTSLPDLSASDLTLGGTFMGTIGKFIVWSDDLTDVGIEEAST